MEINVTEVEVENQTDYIIQKLRKINELCEKGDRNRNEVMNVKKIREKYEEWLKTAECKCQLPIGVDSSVEGEMVIRQLESIKKDLD